MRFLCLHKSAKPERTPPTQKEMDEMGKLIQEAFKPDGFWRPKAACPARLALVSGAPARNTV